MNGQEQRHGNGTLVGEEGQGGVGRTEAEQGVQMSWKHGVGSEEGWEALTRMFIPPELAVSPSSASKDAP